MIAPFSLLGRPPFRFALRICGREAPRCARQWDHWKIRWTQRSNCQLQSRGAVPVSAKNKILAQNQFFLIQLYITGRDIIHVICYKQKRHLITTFHHDWVRKNSIMGKVLADTTISQCFSHLCWKLTGAQVDAGDTRHTLYTAGRSTNCLTLDRRLLGHRSNWMGCKILVGREKKPKDSVLKLQEVQPENQDGRWDKENSIRKQLWGEEYNPSEVSALHDHQHYMALSTTD